MNKFKKIFLGIVTACGVTTLACGVSACSKAKHYRLDFNGTNVDFVMQGALVEKDADGNTLIDEDGNPVIFRSGGTVKKGVTVEFTVVPGANAVEETPVVTANGETLTPDEAGVYSFVMQKETVVTASIGGEYDLAFSNFEGVTNAEGGTDFVERRVHFLDEKGNELSGKPYINEVGAQAGYKISVPGGSTFKFKLDISCYYTGEVSVSNGYNVLLPDKDGVYTVENIAADTVISVTGLTEEEGFVNREGCGSGTETDPYLLSKPIDMFYLAGLVNSSMDTTYRSAYYKLVADIDMQGEQMFTIGDGSETDATPAAAFSGYFDGNGKTISNFYVTDEVIEQSTFERAFLNHVGVFGYVSATATHTAVIKNLTIKDFKVEAHTNLAATSNDGTFAGALVGFGVGAEITNCHARGSVVMMGDNNHMMYTGGIVGVLQGAYSDVGSTTIEYDAYVRGCSSDVTIEGTGSPRSAGGIAGYLVSASKGAIAYVTGSYATGSVSGAMHTGGVVGTLGRLSCVSDCYSTSTLAAYNGIDAYGVSESFLGAYAGGIAGYAEEDSVISGCYAANASKTATSVRGSAYSKTGDIYGGYSEAQTLLMETAKVVEVRNAVKSEGDGASVFTDILGWSDAEWDFSGALPAIKYTDAERTVKITVMDGETKVGDYTRKVTVDRAPLHNWYKDGDLAQYLTGTGGRSWGYYFDKELTQRAPNGFTPVNDITLYVGFADYGEIAGRYYIQATDFSNGTYLQLDADGTYTFRNGGMSNSGTYEYDGKNKKAMLYDASVATLVYDMSRLSEEKVAFEATKTDGRLELVGLVSVVSESTMGTENESYDTEKVTLTALTESADFFYGAYGLATGAQYSFNRDGSGIYTDVRGVSNRFTYTVDGDDIEIVLPRGTVYAVAADGVIATINGSAATAKNDFNGMWKVYSTAAVSFDFDGIDSVTFKNGNDVQTVNYVYDSEHNRAAFTAGGTAYEAYFANGLMVINGVTYARSNSFAGSWYLPGRDERATVTFNGIGLNGFGYASVSYQGNTVTNLDAQYDVVDTADGLHLRLYVNDMQYAELTYDRERQVATGLFYSMENAAYFTGASLYPYDAFRGTWVSGVDGMDTVTFNGMSASNLAEVTVRAASGTTRRGVYSLKEANKGTLTVGESKYEIVLDELSGRVAFKLTDNDRTDTLARRDSWYNTVLYDGETSYTFDGKGYVGGKVAVSGADALDYSVDADGVVTLDGVQLVPDASGFVWGARTLEFKTGFAGEWLVGGTRKKLTVTQVDGTFTAKVSFEDVDGIYDFVYSPSDNVLTYTRDENGERVITELHMAGSEELNITSGGLYISCIPFGTQDAYMGVYTAEDGSSWTFDGLGKAVYGMGTATFKAASGAESRYSYKINVLGVPNIRTTNGAIFIPVTGEEKGYTVQGGQTSYKTVATDALYGTTAYATEDSKRVNYVFDGVGVLWKDSGSGYVKAYTYRVINSTAAELTDDGGKKYNGMLQTVGRNKTIDIDEQKLVYTEEEGEKLWFAVVGKLMYIVTEDGYKAVYSYTVVSDTEWTVTDVENVEYKVVFEQTADGVKMTITKK